MLPRVIGYQALVDFEKEIKAGTAIPGTTLMVNEPPEVIADNDACRYINSKSMKKIGQLIASGKMPPNTTIYLYISNSANEDFKHIASALKTGKCPENFKLVINFNKEDVLERYVKRNGRLSRRLKLSIHRDFAQNWIPELEEALQSGQCPVGLHIQFLPLSRDLKRRIAAAEKRYLQLIAQQQAVVLAQGANQEQSIFQKDILNLICYFLLNPKETSSSKNFDFVKQFRDKSLLISASCFLHAYWSVNSSAAAKEFKQDLSNTLALTVSVQTKAAEIRRVVPRFLEQSLGVNKDGEFVKRKAVALAGKFSLFDRSFVQESPKKECAYRLSPQFYIWKKEQQKLEKEKAKARLKSASLSDVSEGQSKSIIQHT